MFTFELKISVLNKNADYVFSDVKKVIFGRKLSIFEWLNSAFYIENWVIFEPKL